MDIEKYKAELEKKTLEELEIEKNKFYAFQYALKILSNLLYGVLGNKYFFAFNKDVVETVTLQARDVLLYMMDFLNFYFKNVWKDDIDLHKRLGINVLRNVSEDIDLTFFGVTDSIFLRYDKILDTIDNKDNLNILKFILDLYNFRLKKLINIALEKYAKMYNVENKLNLSMETISRRGLWTGKNRYVLHLLWENNQEFSFEIDGNEYKGLKLDDVKIVGFEVKSKKYSHYIREMLNRVIEFFIRTDNLTVSSIDKFISGLKYEYRRMNIEDISLVSIVNNYKKYVIDDKDTITLKKGCPIHIKASAVHNYLIFKNKLYNKYNYLKDGDRIKYYYSNDNLSVFAYEVDHFPYEIALPFDFNIMFEKTIMNVVNRLKQAVLDKDKSRMKVSLQMLF